MAALPKPPPEAFTEGALPPPPPGAVKTLIKDRGWMNAGLKELRAEAGAGLSRVLSGNRPEMSMAADFVSGLLNPVPGSLGDAAMMVLDPAIALSPGVGFLRKAATMGALHGTREAVEGTGEPMERGARIAAATGLGAATGALAGGISNLRAGPALRELVAKGRAVEVYGSPELRQSVRRWTQDPFLFTSEKTLRQMRRGASAAIQDTFDQIVNALPANHLVPLKSVPPMQEAAALRDLQSGRVARHGVTNVPVIPAEQALRIRMRLKADGNDLWHDVERDILDSIEPVLQDRYKGALGQYAQDHRLIDSVAATQASRELPSGANRTDFPLLAPAERSLKRGPEGSTLYHAARGLAEPGSTFGAIHLGEAARRIAKGAGSLAKYSPPSDLQRFLAGLGAGGVAEAGAATHRALDK